MIKIIRTVYYCDLDNNPGTYYESPMIPASGRYRETSSSEDSGRIRKVELSYNAPYVTPGMKRNLAILVVFDDGDRRSFGSADLPARLKIVEDTVVSISCEHQSPER